MLEFPEAFEHREEAEVHRAHVERGDFRLELARPQALLDRHRRSAAGGEVDHAVRALLDICRNGAKAWGAIGLPVVGIARVEMHDRRAGSAAPMRFGDLRRRTGRCGDIDGVWIEPVIAQVMMTLRLLMGFLAAAPDYGIAPGAKPSAIAPPSPIGRGVGGEGIEPQPKGK